MSERPMRKIVAWEYFGNNSTWGYAAELECGHERRDLSDRRFEKQIARCWECPPEPDIADDYTERVLADDLVNRLCGGK